MRIGAVICLLIFVVAALLALAQMWLAPLDAGMFIKLEITLAVLFVVVLAIALVKREYVSEKKMKDEGYLD